MTSPLPGKVATGHIPQHDGLVHGAGHQCGVVAGALTPQHLNKKIVLNCSCVLLFESLYVCMYFYTRQGVTRVAV